MTDQIPAKYKIKKVFTHLDKYDESMATYITALLFLRQLRSSLSRDQYVISAALSGTNKKELDNYLSNSKNKNNFYYTVERLKKKKYVVDKELSLVNSIAIEIANEVNKIINYDFEYRALLSHIILAYGSNHGNIQDKIPDMEKFLK